LILLGKNPFWLNVKHASSETISCLSGVNQFPFNP
jgi:hypothetical protein